MMSSMVGERRPPVRLGIGVDLDHVVLPAGEEGDEVDLGFLDGKADPIMFLGVGEGLHDGT